MVWCVLVMFELCKNEVAVATSVSVGMGRRILLRALFEIVNFLFTVWNGFGTTGVVEAGALTVGALVGALAVVALTDGTLTVRILGLAPVRVLAGALTLGALIELDFWEFYKHQTKGRIVTS